MMIGTRDFGAHARRHFEPVELGQHQVEDDQVGFLERLLQTREPVARGFDFEAFVFELEASERE
jgi:hypothetical protein